MLKNINLLVTFECAARYRSYSLAAEELCISQAAVSQQMRQLERSLTCRLFIRKNRKMLLTQQGKMLFEHTQKALNIINTATGKLQSEGVAGELTVSSTQAFISLWLMPRLQRFYERHPDIQIHFVSSAAFDDLRQSHIDVAIRFGSDDDVTKQPGMASEYFGENRVYPVCSPREAEKLKHPNDLRSCRLVTLEKPGSYDWMSWCKHARVEGIDSHNSWTYVATTDMALNAVIHGHGVALSVSYLCQEQRDKGQLVVPFDLPHPIPVKRYFIYDAQSAKRTRLDIFMQWLKDEMASECEFSI
ncbi:LysR substrate-binding domain-containing protein [Veronia pacifica]|uniref:LysR family transcriptional regulator n=1 Tax=Veronia pacifica TaxID=1080227 RepID=A0A1C3EDU7_9GAMM|nr:LysR substrate-binding domain-containing protein [Veronia pacifica]ODA31405.1 LysR family transcriptional regulator [Veronia pacifica]